MNTRLKNYEDYSTLEYVKQKQTYDFILRMLTFVKVEVYFN